MENIISKNILEKSKAVTLDKLSSEVNSNSEETVATSKAVKMAYDKALSGGGSGGSVAPPSGGEDGGSSGETIILPVELINPRSLRQTVLNGRQKDGYPAYLVGPEFLNMEHEDGVYHTKRGTVSCSSEHNASYRGTKPLRNQVVYQSNGWLTLNNTVQGYWQYIFNDGPHVICGMFLSNRENTPTFSIKKWELLGRNKDDEDWEVIYKKDSDQSHRGYNNNLKSHGRMHWFTENKKAYSQIRIQVYENHGGAYSEISVLRFYESVIPGQHQNSLFLYATPEEPFEVTIASGQQADPDTGNVTFQDSVIRINRHLELDVTKFLEMSRNYIYITTYEKYYNEDGSVNEIYHMDGSPISVLYESKSENFVILTMPQKIQYGSINEIENQTIGLLYSTYDYNLDPVPNGKFEHNKGPLDYPLTFTNVRITTDERFGEFPSSYYFKQAGNNYISADKNLSELDFPNSNKHPYSNECTVELAFKWHGGPAASTTDDYYVLFDQGYNSSRGWTLAYYNRRKTFVLQWHGQGMCYGIPYNAEDNKWHYISVSVRNKNLYVHIDGKCLLATDDTPQFQPYYKYWMIGRWIHSNSHPWYGYVNCLRYTIGTTRYQGGDYKIFPTKDNAGEEVRTIIPFETIWYNRHVGCVQKYMPDGKWYDMPLLPIGHIDTGRKEHLLTDQPRGTYLNMQCKGIDPTGFSETGKDNGNTAAASLFNFGESGGNPYACPGNNNTIEHMVTFATTEPRQFETLRFCNTTWDWRSNVCLFDFGWFEDKVADDESEEVIERVFHSLVKRDKFIDDGGFIHQTPVAIAASHNVQTYKTFDIPDYKPVKNYYIKFLPKGSVTFYKDYPNTVARIMLTLAKSVPEILERSSYLIGDTWELGPVPISCNTDALIPVPFGNIPYTVDGTVEDEQNFAVGRRKLGQTTGWYSNGHSQHGERIYIAPDTLTLSIGNAATSLYNGATWDKRAVNIESDRANYYIRLERVL